MKVTKEKTVYQLTFLPGFFPVNCYLIEEEKDLTLIDAALPFSVKGILRSASLIGKPIARIILTHAHEDHVGALDGLKNALPNAKVYISKRDARLLTGDKSLDPAEPNTPIRGGVPQNLKTTRADVLLEDGDHIGSLLAISSPGHTPGSMAFLDTRNNSLIAGDAFQTKGGIAVAGKVQPLFPFPAMGTWNKMIALESARKLLKLKPTLLATGHGRMIVHPEEAMKTAIAEAEKIFI
ncbi:metallo-beta-lactamase family protein [Bacillus methanolicus PB1]|uniref:Metallo-beta-lactamase family protein n=1 Tax=Bacillus methanolicus PB1 TaxID=997296 RepID=I3DVB4_BACMT|nr:MBL fold metallo-hydrolase [Bacillus methanolicus]EIJ78185.1 metallo-beta-lactamase family protein [Bacillus methanolicus PB1]